MSKVISYFSYKGGAGRSTLAYNTIPFLVSEQIQPTEESPVIVVDMDIDSCGMSYLLEIPNKTIKEDACVQHILKNGCDSSFAEHIYEHETLKNLIPVGKKFGYDNDRAVLFLPAKDMKNVKNSGNFNYDDANSPFLSSLESFVETCDSYDVPAIIFDSAVGNQASANVSNQLADVIVCCMRPTTQFVDGTVRYLDSLDSDASSPLGGGLKNIVLVPNVVPQDEIKIDGDVYPGAAITRIINRFSTVLDDRDEDDDIIYNSDLLDEDDFGIPAIKSFMWREGQLFTQDKATFNETEKKAYEKYRKLAEIIENI